MLRFKQFLEEKELLLMANLSPAEMLKYDWRVDIFIDKYQKNDPFEIGSKKVILKYEPEKANILKKRNRSELQKLVFIGQDNKEYKLTDFTKNKEFGGKGVGFSTAKEDRELNSLIKQIDDAKSVIKKATVPILINKKIYDVFTAVSTPGNPKSDFHLLDINGKEIVWISHKDGKTPKDFQQWSGMSEKIEPALFNDKETQKFIKDVREKFNGIMPSATTVARKIISQNIKNMAIYGNNYGKSFGRQNVTILLQGSVILEKNGQIYTLMSNNTHFNGEKMTGGYDPVFMAIYKGDRSNFGVKGARFAIQPLASRKITEFI